MKQRIKQVLSQHEKGCITLAGLTAAAVLIPLYEKAGEHYIILTKRTDKVEYHKGQISFPGGRKEEDDRDLLATALRESYEEIGLRPEVVEILGELSEERTISSRFVICPFVAFIPYPYQFQLCYEEVAQLLEIPISELLDKANLRKEVISNEEGEVSTAYYYYYKDHVIWGATARILKKLLNLIPNQN